MAVTVYEYVNKVKPLLIITVIKYSFFSADERLSNYIFSYGTIMVGEGKSAPLLSPPNGMTGFLIRTVSGPNAELILKEFKPGPIATQPSYVIGQISYPINFYAVGEITYLVVFFQPLGLYQLFGYNRMNELANKSIGVLDFLGEKKGEILLKELMSESDTLKQINILNNFFLQQFPVYNDCTHVKIALDLIHEAKGNISIKTILEKCDLSRRTLERAFRDKIGISPKVYTQVFRFKCTMNYLKENPLTTWSELSNIIGFFDQPHLIRYFKKYLKVSPNTLVQLDLELINYLLHH
jgi:AraC-like DNA-binding protein